MGLVSNSSQLGPKTSSFLVDSVLEVTDSLGDFTTMTIGDENVEFHHGRGETDDHLWIWFPNKKWVATGDFVIWNFPNAGNPQKVQRWPAEWAATLRQIVAKEPELLLPAHGLPIAGKVRIANVLNTIADALENLVREVVDMMNSGATLDEIIHSVAVPPETLAKPYMRPFYDEPEFVIHNIWRLYGGWWDGAPSRLKPARDADLAREVATLSGGSLALAHRALELSRDGDDRLASHLADFAGWSAPDDPEVHAIRQEVYTVRRKRESSLMSKGIFMSALRESQRVVDRNK
jgi:alkyl sulfatase BDS1-like metallo-beta-lactamase superfamily hydrolase